jgi:hypothetical protein
VLRGVRVVVLTRAGLAAEVLRGVRVVVLTRAGLAAEVLRGEYDLNGSEAHWSSRRCPRR